MTYTSMQTVTVMGTPTVAIANSATHTNIKKLKVYLSNEKPRRQHTEKIRK
jgi:hypothetical protein